MGPGAAPRAYDTINIFPGWTAYFKASRRQKGFLLPRMLLLLLLLLLLPLLLPLFLPLLLLLQPSQYPGALLLAAKLGNSTAFCCRFRFGCCFSDPLIV